MAAVVVALEVVEVAPRLRRLGSWKGPAPPFRAGNTPVGENVGEPVQAAGTGWTYLLSGDDADAFTVGTDTGQVQTRAALDFEVQAVYRITITASNAAEEVHSIDVTIDVTNVDEPGIVTLLPDRPVANVAVAAALTDPDGDVTDVAWSWERSADNRTWRPVSGATADSYTPLAGDVGNYLRATARYTDSQGPDKEANGITEVVSVGASSPTGLTAVPGDKHGEVAPGLDTGCCATAHWVWSVGADGTAGKWTAGQAGSAVVGDLETGVAYWFVVIEELGQRDGASQWSEYSNWSQSGPRTQRNPTGLAAEPGNNPGEVALTWTPVADATAHWIWSVKIDGTDGKWTAGQAGSAVVGDLEAGQAYWFVVIEELGQQDGASHGRHIATGTCDGQ